MFKSFAIKKYYKKLYPFLIERYRVYDGFSKGQVLRTVNKCGFNQKHAVYALGLFLEKDVFEQLASEFPDVDLQMVRAQLSDKFFNGDKKFSFKQYKGNFGGSNNYSENIGGITGGGGD